MNPRNDTATVAVFTALYPPASRGGGPIRSTEAMVAASPAGVVPIVLTGDRDLGAHEPMAVPRNTWTTRGGIEVRYTSPSLADLFKGFRELKRRRPSLLYFNSFFEAKFTILPLMLWRIGFWGRPKLLVAPRGEFGSGALNRRTAKKRLYMQVFRLLGIHRSVVWHSTAAHESEDIRKTLGSNARIILRENHTLLPLEAQTPPASPGAIPDFVFLGRLVEHKGLNILLKALAGFTDPLQLSIYGPEEDQAYVDECKALAARLPDCIAVEFNGAVAPDDVRKVISSYDALLLPTAGENFGHVIAEALSVSCPVMVTATTPWTQTLQQGGGVVVADRNPANWATALQNLATASAAERLQLRQAAAGSYETWRSRAEAPHVWSLALEQ